MVVARNVAVLRSTTLPVHVEVTVHLFLRHGKFPSPSSLIHAEHFGPNNQVPWCWRNWAFISRSKKCIAAMAPGYLRTIQQPIQTLSFSSPLVVAVVLEWMLGWMTSGPIGHVVMVELRSAWLPSWWRWYRDLLVEWRWFICRDKHFQKTASVKGG